MNPIDDLKNWLPQCLLYDQVRLGSRLAVLLRSGAAADSMRREIEDLSRQARRSADLCARRAMQRPEVRYPESLPVALRREEIVAAIRNHPVVVIAGETGSGKTTQIPKMCLEAGLGIRGKIGCTQPRRVAALTISRRVAEELSVPWGKQVGCKIRFSDQTSPETLIKFMTDGILLAETQGDPHLSEYDTLVLDEAHERSLNIDFLLGHLRQLVTQRRDLKVVITSATIDTNRFAAAFGNAPIIEVSGRLYPVDAVYRPLDPEAEEEGDQTYVDAAATTVEDILTSSSGGDILVFLPGERDIRELRDLLESRGVGGVNVIPMFGRLSGSDQQRVFAESPTRKVVLATNIAETSITIPGIRYVVDAGLARLSRYNSRSRTKRLPIEPVSQSSANQRKGRCGRVEAGVCYRLYSEEDFLARPLFTQPEIQRANLAEVILRMKSARLGEIETFPFLDMPSPAAIRAGYDLLQELGALDANRALTPLGADLAKLPVDPTIGRIVLQSHREGVLDEVLVIASGLSIQDPRERPFEEAAAATSAHRKFQHPTSDFLTLLNLWIAFHEQWQRLKTQNQLRKFCKANFLSYLRMREWVDIHAQLEGTFHETMGASGGNAWDEEDAEGEEGAAENPTEAAVREKPVSQWTAADKKFQAVHRAILTGLLGHVAQRSERNLYKATGNRVVAVFPASTLHDKGTPQKPAPQPRGSASAKPVEKARQPEWIVAGEIVETSRLFARTLVGDDPDWIAELGAHLCKCTHDQARWDPVSGQVIARERVTYHGLELIHRRVAYGPIAPKEATAIFIRTALVEEGICDVSEEEPEPRALSRSTEATRPAGRRRWQLQSAKFIEYNRALRERIEAWQTRSRHHSIGDLDEAFCRFYARLLTAVSSVQELNKLVQENSRDGSMFLLAQERDIVGDVDTRYDATAFPSTVSLGTHSVPIDYAYAPGEDRDGATLKVPVGLWSLVKEASVAWSVPGLREEQIALLLKELPRTLRRDLQPHAPKVLEIIAEFKPAAGRFLDELAAFISRRYQVPVPAGTWQWEQLPNHLRPRVELMGPHQKPIAAGRDLGTLEKSIETVKAPAVDDLWKQACARFEKPGATQWSFGSIPKQVELTGSGGAMLVAFPGLVEEAGHVALRLFRKESEAARRTLIGWARLLEFALSRDLAWVQKDLRSLERHKILFATMGSGDELVESAFVHLKRKVFPAPQTLDENSFQAAVVEGRELMKGVVPPFVDCVGQILQRRQELLTFKTPYPKLREELDRLVPKDFLIRTPPDRLPHLLRYLRAMRLRAERAALNTLKDQERSRLVQPYADACCSRTNVSEEKRETLERLRWMVEEFKVSVFAQELGTAEPVSAKRLQALVEELGAA